MLMLSPVKCNKLTCCKSWILVIGVSNFPKCQRVISINPSNAEATFVRSKKKRRDFWKPSKPCHVGIHWIALAEYSQGLEGFQIYCALDVSSFSIGMVNPSTLRVPVQSIVCNFHTFENILGMKSKFTKYLKESCCLTSGYHFSFKYFSKNALVRKIFLKLSGLFWPLGCEWVNIRAAVQHPSSH